tara:strand:- start:6217 stop:6597 length:381 start_codon:yes stop_codon:yes gene_type:complete
MDKVSHIMRDYFNEKPIKSSTPRFLLSESQNMPIKPDIIKWKVVTDPERFMRRFEFSSRSRLIDFLGEVLELEDEMNHHAKITISHLHIDIEVYTHSIDCITELDIEYTSSVDQIYEDVLHYGYNE